ncbi:hypothetical protein JAAARDRAFT_715957 [Jaapia argillacea MUCL 33604]|uniref:F-box domain-containing protein n=1 Tax=Jaapia argillacea MUCL 33604 TaxID=933084 RepID=A0A067PE59_9AGAM|nr:hypothetical protein JAAARDRAFT_715957 [Jaapia argillacea MUCL 33604]
MLSTLCIDILIRILSHMDPQDIINSRQCCRSLRDASLRRIVWIDAVHRISCESKGIGTRFLTDRMSIHELEHVATAPCRFISRIRRSLKRGDKFLLPISIRLLNLNIPSGVPPARLTMLRLLPGGQFLITSNFDCKLELWDLRFMPNALIPPLPIASVVVPNLLLEGNGDGRLIIQPIEDGSGFYILVVPAPKLLNGEEWWGVSSQSA